MAHYITGRLAMMVPVLIGVTLIVFLLARVLPGDVATAQAGQGGFVTPQVARQRKHELGLDRPLPQQYTGWLGHAVRLDFQQGLWDGRSINGELGRAIPVTLELTLVAALIGIAVAIPLGLVSAVWRGSIADNLARLFGVTGMAVPDFVLGTLAISYLAVWFRWTPPAGYVSLLSNPLKNVEQFLIPGLILGLRFSASVMRFTRTTLLGVLREDYIRTATAKGLSNRVVIIRHGLRSGLLPVVTVVGAQIGYLLGGSIIVETIFSLSGVGALTIAAISNRDYMVLQAVTFLAAIVFVFINFIVDLSYMLLDPRVQA